MRRRDRAVGCRATLAVILATATVLATTAVPAGGASPHRDPRARPHRQALAGSAGSAGLRVVKAPPVGGKGGGVDPGDDYPPRWKDPPQDSALDPWREFNRECTSFVAWALHARNGFDMPFHKNANHWGRAARRLGYLVNAKPGLGSVAWSNTGVWGHVAYVVAINGGNVTVEEYNYLKHGAYDKRVVSADSFTGFIHFKDLPVESTPIRAPVSVESPADETVSETSGGVVNTWSDYLSGEGVPGPSMPSNYSVQVGCAVTGFRVADGNTWWYRIASSPWNDAYYASADAFYNNGKISGSQIGTPFVDPAVPAC